jgi:signal transduction histidine kinase
MGSLRGRATLGALLGFGLLLTGWTIVEAERQRRETETALANSASLLAHALGPGLMAASTAVEELDEIVTWKLLDNARLFAAIGLSGAASLDRLARLAEDNGLDGVVFLDSDGTEVFAVGSELDAETRAQLRGVLEGSVDELVLGSRLETTEESVSVAARRPEGGAVVVSVEASAARTFTRRLGVENLLESLVGTGGLLYLAYREEPSGVETEASWDGSEVPSAPTEDERERPLRGRSVFEVDLPLESLAGREAVLRVGLDAAPIQRAAAAARRRTLLIGIVLAAFALAATGVAIVNRRRSLEREAASQRLAGVEAARQRSERLAAAGALTAGLAHEVRSPMNAIGLAAQRLERKLAGNEELRSIAARIRGEVVRLEAVLREFLELASPVSERTDDVDLGAIGSEVCELLAAEAAECRVTLYPPRGSATVRGDGEALRRAIINLVRNALQASPPGGSVRLTIEGLANQVIFRITDEGSGVDPALEDRVFDAFVTGRPSGTGLGLSLVRRVAEEHGGSVQLQNRAVGGAEARLRLPKNGRR